MTTPSKRRTSEHPGGAKIQIATAIGTSMLMLSVAGHAQTLAPISLFADLRVNCNVNGSCTLPVWATLQQGDVTLVSGDAYYLTDVSVSLLQPLAIISPGQPTTDLVNATIEADVLVADQVVDTLLVHLDGDGVGSASDHFTTGIQIKGSKIGSRLTIALMPRGVASTQKEDRTFTPTPTQKWTLGSSKIILRGRANSSFVQHFAPNGN